MRRLLPALMVLLLPLSAPAADDIQGVTAVWRDFVASIRRGDYPNAHSLFSAQSQNAMPYGEFVAEYGPLSAAREMVLAKPDSQATDLDQDWAEITYGGTNPGSGRKFKVGVAFVKNEGGWGLVAARNEMAERVEAGARALLRMLWNARGEGKPQALVATLTRLQEENPVLQFYRLETDGTTFRSFPLQKGLRTFYVDNWGLVKSAERTPMPPRRATAASLPTPGRSALPLPEKKEAVKPAVNRDEMQELSEPPPRSRKRVQSEDGLNDDPPEPPMRRNGTRPGQPPRVMLPDTIR